MWRSWSPNTVVPPGGQETEQANQQYTDRQLSYYYDDSGALVINARLPAEQGALVVKALEE